MYGNDMPTAYASENIPGSRTDVGVGAAFLGGKTLVVENNLTTHRYEFTQSSSAIGGWSSWATLPASPTFAALSEPYILAYSGASQYFLILGIENSTGLL